MKNILLLLLAVTGIFFACQKGDVLSDALQGEEVSADRGGNGPHGPRPGRCLRGDTIELADLPAAIAGYVAANYAGATIVTAVAKPNGAFGVELSTGMVLLFGADGAFIRECDGEPHHGPGGPHGNPCMHGDSVGVADLPAAIGDYVTANYAGAVIDAAATTHNGGFAVQLSTGTVLLFGADGAFLHECGLQPPHHGGNRCLRGDSISVADLPAAIATYVETTYPGATITTAVQKPNGAFGVELGTGEVLLFDAEGVFVRICDGQPGGGNGGGHGGHGGGH